MKKTFILYLKSYSEEPDFEREVEAENKEEALELLRMKYPILNEYPDEYLLEHLDEAPSEDYPLGGTIEPYDIWKEDQLTNN